MNNKKLKIFGEIVAIVLLFALELFVSGIVLMYMWNWFIVPLGLPKIGFWLAYGIMITIRLFRGVETKARQKDENYFVAGIAHIIVHLATWGIGAIIHLFI